MYKISLRFNLNAFNLIAFFSQQAAGKRKETVARFFE